MTQACIQCNQPVHKHDKLCAACLEKFDKTVLLHNDDLTVVTTKPLVVRKNRKKVNVVPIVIGLSSIVLLLGYLIANHLHSKKTIIPLSTSTSSTISNPPDSNEFMAYSGTPLMHPNLYKDMNVSIYDSKITLGKSTPDDIKKIFVSRKTSESTTGDEYSLFYDNVPQFNEIIFDFKRSVLIRITITSTSSKETKFITGNGFSLGQTIDQMQQVYGTQFLQSSVLNARYEYLDLKSKLYTLFEDLPDHKDGHIDYIFIEKYDLAKPSSYKSFENEKIQREINH